MPFSTLVGNDLAKSALARMAEKSNVPSTLLFYGPDGVGKSLFAISLAELLMGPSHATKLASHNHPDLHILRPEGKSSTHPIENIRKLIDEVALPPFEAPVKVFIIHDVHQMLPASSNALLKTFEEPPPDTFFILLTSSIDAVLPTIVSRCRKVPFFPIPQSQIIPFIEQKWKKSSEESRRIAFFSHGSLAKAQLLAEHHSMPLREPLLELLSLRLPEDYPQFTKLAAEIETHCTPDEDNEEEGHPQTDALFEEIIAYFRDLHLLKEGIASDYLYHLDSIDRLKLALSHPIPPLEKIIEQTSRSRLALQRHIRLRAVLENFFLNLV